MQHVGAVTQDLQQWSISYLSNDRFAFERRNFNRKQKY